MFEYHGWLVIRAAPYELDDEERIAHETADLLRGLIEELNWPNWWLRDLRWVNGSAQFHFGGYTNHRSTVLDDILHMVRTVAERAPGSYGLIHYLDDEDFPHNQEFQVLVIRRGQVIPEKDTFLSPTIPMIEDLDPLYEES